MLKRTAGFFLCLSLWGGIIVETWAQKPSAPAVSGAEPGLEEAVKWKWRVVPSQEKDWGLELPEPPPPVPMGTSPLAPVPRSASDSYDVKKGDALVLIGKKFGLTVAQLKAANGLKDNMIRIGQVLKIPTPQECLALGLPIEVPTPRAPAKSKGDGKAQEPTAVLDQEVFLLQIFLDRENFTAGPIDGKTNLDFQKLVYLYQSHRGDVGDTELLRAKALAGVGDVMAKYILKPGDFRFIAPPKAEKHSEGNGPVPAPKGKAAPKAAAVPPPNYAEMTAATMLAYRSPWEFVAERFHCREELLHLLNPGIPATPPAGTEFRVPNVIPFQIEKAFALPLQPPADPLDVITAVVVDLTRLEIYRNDRLVAVMPVSPARPGLRGKGTWTILEALPRPRLATRQEPRDVAKPTNTFFTGEGSQPAATGPVLTSDQYLPAGPNNPVGVLWIDLAKSDSPAPLPYGLHGTGIPSQMRTKSGIGGFRLANWDIVRAAHLLPKGAPLQWKQTSAGAPQTARPSL